MGRIRTIKPTFWTDGKISRLSDSSALLFIALWNFSDDFGFFSCDTLELSLKVSRWRSQSLHKMLCSLAEHGLIRLCSSLEVGLIIGWEHQKIRDRSASKWKDLDILWDEFCNDAPQSDRKALGKERKGKEGKGKERKGVAHAVPDGTCTTRPLDDFFPDELEKKSESEIAKTATEETPVQATWHAYSKAYAKRYGIKPTWNTKVAGQLKLFVGRVPQAEAPLIAEFFVSHGDAFYVRKAHAVGLLLADAEKLRTEWGTGKKITAQVAKQSDTVEHYQDQLRRIAKGEL